MIDGPLNFVRSRDVPVIGFVKTHYRPILSPDYHARVPSLAAGERTSIFALRSDVYGCYLRLAASRFGGPWGWTVRCRRSSGSSEA